MEADGSHISSAASPVTDAHRSDALRELAGYRVAGAMTLGELADAARRIQAARTLPELEKATRAPAGEALAAPAPRRWLVVLLGGSSQRGRWRLGSAVRAVCVLGGMELDLRQAIVDGDEVSLTCVCVLGGARLIVPEGVPISFSGFSILGGRSDERAPAAPLPGAPTIHLRLFSLLGGIEITGTGDHERPHRSLELAEDALRVRLSGPLALAALRRELRIPYAAIREVTAEPPELPPAWTVRWGTALPFSDVRHGLIHRHGRWSFYSLDDRHRAITLRLDNFRLNGRQIESVVLGVDDPERWKRELDIRRASP
jgi:hypothetical protein